MKIDLYLIRDENLNTMATFTSEQKALTFKRYIKKSTIERIPFEVPTEATREIHHVNLKDPTKQVKTMKELVYAHITYVVYDLHKGNVNAAARTLKMSPNNLRHKIKQMMNQILLDAPK